jgi:hypothetical protein
MCALPLEAEAVKALFNKAYNWLGKYYSKQQGDANAYINGRIGKHDVVLSYLPGMGKGSAARVASSLLVSYPGVRLALVIGICGGAPPPFPCEHSPAGGRLQSKCPDLSTWPAQRVLDPCLPLKATRVLSTKFILDFQDNCLLATVLSNQCNWWLGRLLNTVRIHKNPDMTMKQSARG